MDPRRAAVFFDLDGTISDSKPGIVRSIRHAFEGLGLPLDPALDLDWCVGPPLQASLARLLGSEDPARVQEALDRYRERYRRQGIYENELYPGVVDALRALEPSAELYVVTSKPLVFAEEIVRHFGLDGLFRGVFGSELDGARSDKGELVALALGAQGLDPADVVMVGDREHDMAGAKRNAVRGLGALWGYGAAADLLGAGAAWLAEAPAQVPEILRNSAGLGL